MGLALQFDSAGTIGYHQGNLPDARAMIAGRKRGLSFDGISARQVTDADFAKFDLILAADKQNLHDLRLRCPVQYQHKLQLMLSFADTETEEVPDPYYGGAEGFEQVLDLLELSAQNLLASIKPG